MAKPRVRPGTYDSYRYVVESHVVPWLGRHRLDVLSPAIIQSWLADLQAAGVSPRSARYARSILANALNDAVRHELVARNPADAIRAPRVIRQDPRSSTSTRSAGC
jgi:site-specific recombinase XerC